MSSRDDIQGGDGVPAFRILQLTDLHFGTPNLADHQDLIIQRLHAALDAERSDFGEFDLVLITGDLVWGKSPGAPAVEEQWAVFKHFVDELMSRGVIPSQSALFIVPGNHDLDRDAVGQMSHNSIDTMDPAGLTKIQRSKAEWDFFRRAQARFDQILDELNVPYAADFAERGWYASSIAANGSDVAIAGFNTSFAAVSDSDKDRLWIGRAQLDYCVSHVNGHEFRFAVAHHPTAWLSTKEQLHVEQRLREEFNVLFHGHEHIPLVRDEADLLTISGGATYEPDSVRNFFHVLTVDPGARAARLRTWELTSDSGHQWRPCTQRRYDSDGFVDNMQVGALFPQDSGARTLVEITAAKPAEPSAEREFSTIREWIAHLERAYQYRWEPNSFRTAEAYQVFWPVRLRLPTVIHAVQSFVAAAMMRLGVTVHLAIDDLGSPEISSIEPLTNRINYWIALAGGDPQALQVSTFDHCLQDPSIASTGWSTVRAWWKVPDETIRRVFEVTKLVTGQDADSITGVASRSPRRLMAPAMLWSMLGYVQQQFPAAATVTLGGDDERPLWDTWQRFADAGTSPTGHLFVPAFRDRNGSPIHMMSQGLGWRSLQDVREFIEQCRRDDPEDGAIEWLQRQCVGLLREIREVADLRDIAGHPATAFSADETDPLIGELSYLMATEADA